MREMMTITGDFRPAELREWALHRAERLSLGVAVTGESDNHLSMSVEGPEALLDAMAIACSLGPARAHISEVLREPAT